MEIMAVMSITLMPLIFTFSICSPEFVRSGFFFSPLSQAGRSSLGLGRKEKKEWWVERGAKSSSLGPVLCLPLHWRGGDGEVSPGSSEWSVNAFGPIPHEERADQGPKIKCRCPCQCLKQNTLVTVRPWGRLASLDPPVCAVGITLLCTAQRCREIKWANPREAFTSAQPTADPTYALLLWILATA